MKRMIVACVALCGVALNALADGFDDLYTEETGYVTLKKSDSSNGESFDKAGNWSDGNPPHPETNYYVGAGLILRTRNDATQNTAYFAGNKLVIAGQITHSASSSRRVLWGDTVFLPGSKYYFNSIGPLYQGDFYYEGTEENPSLITINRSDTPSNIPRTLTQYQNLHSGPDAFVTVRNSGTGVWFSHQGDWSDFYGTFTCPTNRGIQITQRTAGFSMPGRFVVPAASTLALMGTANVVTIGALSVESGGTVCFASGATTSLLHVTNSLELAAGAIVDSSNTFNCAVLEAHTSTVFRISPRAVAAGLPDWSKVVFPYRSSNGAGEVPHIYPFEVDDPEVEGGKYVGITMKPVVRMTNQCLSSKSAFDLKYNHPEEFWSNGRWPEPGYDYIAIEQTLIKNSDNPYVFPGDSYTVYRSNFGFYESSDDLTFDDLSLIGASAIRLMGGTHGYTMRGKLKLIGYPAAPAAALIKLATSRTLTIASEISGDNSLNVMLDTPNGYLNDLIGTLILTGVNTNWTGTLSISTTNDVYLLASGDLSEVSAESTLTLRVGDARSLGGPLPEFAFDSLAISNRCRLAVDATTTFSEPTRGWYIPRSAFLYVTNGAVATCANTVTLGGELVKEGEGALSLATAPVQEGEGASIAVSNGTLAVAASGVIDGLPVNFGPGTALGIDINSGDADILAKGLDLRNVSISSVDERLSVTVVGLPDDPAGGSYGPYAIFTYDAAQSGAVASAYSVRSPWGGSMVAVCTEDDNGDGTKTLKAMFHPCGARIMVR